MHEKEMEYKLTTQLQLEGWCQPNCDSVMQTMITLFITLRHRWLYSEVHYNHNSNKRN